MALRYLQTIDEFCSLSPFSRDQAAELEAREKGQLMELAATLTGVINAMLGQRGDVPFLEPYPDPVRIWLADLMTPRAFEAHGTRPSDETQQSITARELAAMDMLRNAGDAKIGTTILPLQNGSKTKQAFSQVTLAYSEVNPYTGKHRRHELIRSGRG